MTLIRRKGDTQNNRKNLLSIKWIIFIAAVGIVIFVASSIPNISKFEKNSENTSILIANNTPYVKEYPLPDGIWPNGILVDKNGIVWVASSKINSLLSFDPKNGKVDSYQIQDDNLQENLTGQLHMVWTMLQDNDGLIWLSQLGTGSVLRFDPSTGKFDSEHSVSAAPFQMKMDKYGKIWFTTLTGHTVGVIQKIMDKNGKYKITEFSTGNGTQPAGLFLANDDLWVTEISSQKIIKYSIKNDSGFVNEVKKTLEIPVNNISLSSPTDLFVLDGTIWLTEHGTSFITKYSTDYQNLTRFPTSQNAYHATTLPFWIREVNNGKGIWFNEHEGNKIAFFNTVNRTLIEYEIPSRPTDGYLVYPLNIAVDPLDENKLWFSEWNTNKIGMVNGKTPIPFEIHSDINKIILNNNSKKQSINIEIFKKLLTPSDNNIVFLNVSSSMQPNASLENVNAKFSINPIDLSKTNQTQLVLRNESAKPGNYTIGISASDGNVTGTIFLDLKISR